jgi:hypothetical protein
MLTPSLLLLLLMWEFGKETFYLLEAHGPK